MPKSERRSAEYIEAKHRELDARCAQLDGRKHLTSAEEADLHRMKKEKLRLKDEMQRF